MDSASINPFACGATLPARADRLLSFDLIETASNHLAYMITPDPLEGYYAERIVMMTDRRHSTRFAAIPMTLAQANSFALAERT
jgi:hypothetical protein